jgi:TRAP-type C4-dicarboxylate transport system substrate-binding protein
MKKRFALVLAVILALTMTLAACSGGGGGSTPAATPSTGGSAPSTPATSDEVYEFIVNVTLAETVSPHWSQLFKDLESKSDGRLNVTVYWANSLMSIPEIPKGLSTGAATFSNVPTNNYPDIMPLNARILELPFMGLQDPVESSEIYMQLIDEFPAIQQEFADYNMLPLAVTTLGMYGLHFTDKKEVHLPADLNGRQVVPYKLEWLPMLEANNAAGSYIPPGQIYEALEKGVVNGYVNNWAFQGWFGLSELMKQHVEMGDYGAFQEFNVICVNLDFYNSLPQDLQQLLVDTFRTNGGYADMWADTQALVDSEKAKAKEKDDLFITLTPAEVDAWKAACEGNHELALDEINAQRGDTVATDIYNRALEIIKGKYGA